MDRTPVRAAWLAGVITLAAAARAGASAVPTVPLDGIWSPLSIAGRSGHAAVLDPVRHRMIVFGGRDHLGSRADLWELPLGPPTRWRRLMPLGDAPPPMERMSVVLDPERDRLLVFGGRDSLAGNPCDQATCRTYGGVWALELGGTLRWSTLLPADPMPEARSGHVAIYDPRRDRMVMFGGEREPDGACPCGTVPERFHDVWALKLHGRPRWEMVSAGGAAPVRSARGSAFYDPVMDRMVYASSGDTLFALSLGSEPAWSAQATNLPFFLGDTLAGGTRIVYEPASDRVYRFANMVVFGIPRHVQASWYIAAQAPPWYSPVTMHSRHLEDFSLILDPHTSSLVLFGGVTPSRALPVRQAAALSFVHPPATWSVLGTREPDGIHPSQLISDLRAPIRMTHSNRTTKSQQIRMHARVRNA